MLELIILENYLEYTNQCQILENVYRIIILVITIISYISSKTLWPFGNF